MSEELLQTIPQQIGKYTYYRLGSTTLSQLRDKGIIPKKKYDKLEAKKPDGLVVYHGQIKAVVEYKQPSTLASDSAINAAIAQEFDVAKALCRVMIVTDSTKTIWVNALNGERIRDAKGNELKTVFHPFVVKNLNGLESLLDEVTTSVSSTNSQLAQAKIIDPSSLAARLWQTIWVATGKSPVKCLYNVVELFIFKFLSDLQVLPADVAFPNIYNKSQNDPAEALEFYAVNTRRQIHKLFPSGADGTTIINGTIFVNDEGEPNLSQSILFQRALTHLFKYGEEYGSLTRIDKQFKTKLYESFLQQEVEALGQYFTPRKVVQAVLRMAGMDSPYFAFSGKRICDPFCGVGGFPLELLNLNESMMNCYFPNSKGKIALPFTLHGFDKGFERDEERTIILAKANMLIYLAEILFKNPKCSKEFAKVFNDTFRLFKDNLGTFGHIIDAEAEKYDFILSNPPYVTSGSSIIKEEIRKTPRTSNAYPINALGLEGLSLEWIVKSLRPGGRSFLIVPDGILGRVTGKKLRNYILSECYLDAIVSLPVRTFFANFEHTYIIAITKKHDPAAVQSEPVFTYLVSDIGERLTSVRREEIESDDLPLMENLFKVFSGAKQATKEIVEAASSRCKIQPFVRFQSESHWVVDRWWTREERIAIGADSATEEVSKDQLDKQVAQVSELLADYSNFVDTDLLKGMVTTAVKLGDPALFRMFIGKRVLKKDVSKAGVGIPAYSANVFEPMGHIEKSNVSTFDAPTLLWGIDGNFAFNLLPEGQEYATTDHCGAIQVLDAKILPEYVLFALHARRTEESFNRSFRASLANMRKFEIRIPIDASGNFDITAQAEIASRFAEGQEKKAKVVGAKARFDELFKGYLVET